MDIVSELRALVGEDLVLDADAVRERASGVGRPEPMIAAALVRPRTTEQVAAVLKWCNEHHVTVVPHGGNSGLVRGTQSRDRDVMLSLESMRTIESIDVTQRTAVVQAGVVLQQLQETAAQADLYFPLDLGGRGSATIGGNAATNAGGNRVIRYGMMRDMVLGLEVVLPDGTIISSLHPYIKNNTGYDLRNLFIGSEGTLGVITRCVVRLREKPAHTHCAMVACTSFANVVELLRHADRTLSGTLSAFEVMWNSFYRLISTPPALGRPPLPQDLPYYVLIEAMGGEEEQFGSALESALESGLICDAVIAQSHTEYHSLWSLRDDMSQLNRPDRHAAFDIPLRAADMEPFLTSVEAELTALLGPFKFYIFGHLGDGNLHLVVEIEPDRFKAMKPEVERLVYGKLKDIGGSISAEHGIGIDKKHWLHASRSPAEIALMKRIKAALDPNNILNPQKIF